MTDDQVAKWKAAIAARHKQQRQQRGRKQNDPVLLVPVSRPGMARITPDTMDEPGGHGAQGEPATTRGRTDGP
jgi:hypothetical protein